MKILIYGYGNPGRMDDGLGNAFVNRMEEWIEELKLNNFFFDSNYQLNIEDADAIADKDFVLFVDASTEDVEDFCVTKVDDSSKVAFTTHAASPGYIVDLCKKINGSAPPTYLLHIKGYEWDFKEGLTKKAIENLEKAIAYFKEKFSCEKKLSNQDYVLK